MPGDAESSPPVQEQMDGGELVRTRTVQDRQRGPAGCSGGILDAAQAPPQLDTDAQTPAPNAQLPDAINGILHQMIKAASDMGEQTAGVELVPEPGALREAPTVPYPGK